MSVTLPNQLFIDNRWVMPDGGERLANVNPADESVIGEVVCASEAEVDEAVAAARRAFVGEWRQTTPWDRGRVLMKISRLISEQVDRLADIEMRETGKPVDAARGAVMSTARYFRILCGCRR